MSTALAIAGVTAVLRDLLNDGLINHDISSVLGSSVTVSVQAPDRVVAANAAEASQLNLFMYLVTPNPGWRNEGLPGRDGSGRTRLSNPPLALNLHYLLSAYSGADLHAEILLGYAMQLLHETPVLTRAAIRAALVPSPPVGNTLPPALRALADAGLAEQLELIKITPVMQTNEELSKFWTATQSHLRPSAAYTASVVLIQAQQPARSALPVLARGPRDAQGRETGIAVQPGLEARLPLLTRAEPPAGFEADFIARVRRQTDIRFRQGLQAMPGARELLGTLCTRGLPIAVATNGPRQKVELSLGLTGLREPFGPHVYCAYEVGSFKPEPGLFLHAAQALGVAPQRCAVVEDSLPGLQAALAAGMRACSLHPRAGLPDAVVQRVQFIERLDDLLP